MRGDRRPQAGVLRSASGRAQGVDRAVDESVGAVERPGRGRPQGRHGPRAEVQPRRNLGTADRPSRVPELRVQSDSAARVTSKRAGRPPEGWLPRTVVPIESRARALFESAGSAPLRHRGGSCDLPRGHPDAALFAPAYALGNAERSLRRTNGLGKAFRLSFEPLASHRKEEGSPDESRAQAPPLQ